MPNMYLLSIYILNITYFTFDIFKKSNKILHVSGDEILSVNGMSFQGMSHSEAISIFKNIKIGPVTLLVTRRDSSQRR